ncbi:RrF2 family transcriptional regulator [Gluconobacter morbifer]|uniref:CDG1D protein n=1 Tax=Gluconobacter morbifer G707 TaxID=1088869 RepID=G6XK10_9PROT|nr:Rrf2 family transcriptional regulator [Gluconobacter morbifer]EHH67972.1 CDG1D protein [Gluconobacter morbifer G707]
MRLTLHTDYALRVLIHLGVHTTRRVSIREIAQAYRISENHLVKVVHRLGQGGFVTTIRGRGGGLVLARPADQIVVGDVIRFTEEDIALVDCEGRNSTDGQPCILLSACVLRGVLGEALGAFMSVFDRYTVADLLTGKEAVLLAPASSVQPERP